MTLHDRQRAPLGTFLPYSSGEVAGRYIGQRFGSLVVTGEAERASNSSTRLRCICDCGGVAVVRVARLTSGETKRCRGCAQRTHGRDGSRVHESWKAMVQRCENPNNPGYPKYGGIGIRVCERWLSFENFLADMGERPEGTSLDRIDNNLGYEPSNCRWATPSEQSRNRRYALTLGEIAQIRQLRIEGARLRDLAERFDVSTATIKRTLRGPQ